MTERGEEFEEEVNTFCRDLDIDATKIDYPSSYKIRAMLIIQDRLKHIDDTLNKILERLPNSK